MKWPRTGGFSMPSARVYNKRLGNNVIQGLETIVAECVTVRPWTQKAIERAEKYMDAQLLLSLIKVKHALGEIERRARDAREARFEEDR
jgi:hypothetical protein